MIKTDLEQYSEEWWQARLGIPTASMFSQIVTSTGKKSQSWKQAVHKLVAEKLRGKPDEGYYSEWMKRGNEMEAEALNCYQFVSSESVSTAGLCYNDTKTAGFSPDALGESHGVEIKCPSPGVHVGYLLGRKIPTTYKPQVFASLYLSGLNRWDFFSYHPDLDPLMVSVYRDDIDFQECAKAIGKYLPLFVNDVETAYKALKPHNRL